MPKRDPNHEAAADAGLRPPLIAVIGCTACGKGAVGFELARRLGAEIVSVDSMKIYRRMDVGTAKPTPQHRGEIPHHLIDVVEPWQPYSAAAYVEAADQAIADIQARGHPALLVGGTVMYLKSLIEGLFEGPGADPAIRDRLRRQAQTDGPAALHQQLQTVDPVGARRIHPNDVRRLVRALEVYELTGRPITDLQTQWDRPQSGRAIDLIGLRRDREDQNHRTNDRVRRMFAAGWVDEVKSLLAEPQPLSRTARQAVGYAEIIDHLAGRRSLADTIEMIKINTRRFAKAQRTWFRRFRDVEWIDLSPDATADETVDRLLARGRARWSTSPK